MICGGALMFNSGYLISRSASIPENILLVYIPIVLTRAFGIGRPVFRYLERLTSHSWVLRMTSNLRLKLYNVVEKDAIFFKQAHRTGDILGLLAEDINHIQNLYLRTIFPTVIAWILYAFLIIGLGYFSWWFAFGMTGSLTPISGGDVNQTYRFTTGENRYFLKTHPHVSSMFFQAEINGLAELAPFVRVPG